MGGIDIWNIHHAWIIEKQLKKQKGVFLENVIDIDYPFVLKVVKPHFNGYLT